MVEYYDAKKKALINITYKKRKPNRLQKKRYYQQKANDLGLDQRNAMSKLVWVRSMASKDIQFAPLDMQDRILEARREQERLITVIEKLGQSIRASNIASQTLKPEDEKQYISVATQADQISLEDILMMDRQQIGTDVFDKAVISHTRKERLKLLNDINPMFNIFTPAGNIRISEARAITGIETSINISKLYEYFTSDIARERYPILNEYTWLRRDFSLPTVTDPEPPALQTFVTE